jgi:hypothetical protein
MRIVIETEGSETRAATVVSGSSPSPPVPETDSSDGGAAPGAGASAGAESDMNGGGPSQDLLDSIAAAEAAGSSASDLEVDASDAGMAPQAP